MDIVGIQPFHPGITDRGDQTMEWTDNFPIDLVLD